MPKGAVLLPVEVGESIQEPPDAKQREFRVIIEARSTRITVDGSVDIELVRTLLECLANDLAASRGPDLDSGGSDRSAARLWRAQRNRENCAARGPVCGRRIRVSRPAWRSNLAALVGWRWPMLIREAFGTRALCLAKSRQRNCLTYTRPAVDVTRRYRLAPARAHMEAGDSRITGKIIS
jgi:hypothetical protein